MQGTGCYLLFNQKLAGLGAIKKRKCEMQGLGRPFFNAGGWGRSTPAGPRRTSGTHGGGVAAATLYGPAWWDFLEIAEKTALPLQNVGLFFKKLFLTQNRSRFASLCC